MTRALVLLLVSASLATAACGPKTASVALSECSSGTKWVGGEEGDPEMHPGRDCIGCHTSSHHGPRYAFAGTVFGEATAKDDCFGRSDVVVRVTGADGAFQDLAPNGAGNFFSSRALVLPYTAELRRAGVVVSRMTSSQTSGACNSCHTAGTSPGRIVSPNP